MNKYKKNQRIIQILHYICFIDCGFFHSLTLYVIIAQLYVKIKLLKTKYYEKPLINRIIFYFSF